MLDTFPTIHRDDLGSEIVGYVYSKPVIKYYPDDVERREQIWRKQLIEFNQNTRRNPNDRL
jgi:hypothetical protein